MNNLYENNIKELRIRKAYTIENFEEVLDDIDIDDNVKVENNIMYFKYNDNYMQINSKFLKSEVDEYIRDVDFQKDNMIILHGIGNVELLKRIFINSTQDSLIIVIEPNSYVMKFVLENFDISWAIKSNMVRFAFGNNDNIRDYFSSCRGNSELAFNIISINNPNYYMYEKDYKEYITQFNKTIKESIFIVLLN